jgi:DNA processing protein
MVQMLNDDERLDWLQLSRTEGIGPITFHRLVARYGSAAAALAALPELSARGGRRSAPKTPRRATITEELERAAQFGAQYIAFGEAEYPPFLAQIPDAPPLLCIAGRTEHLSLDAVAIVGSRNASALGRKFARMLSEQLGRAGYLVVSGLARGIDTAAHEAALTSQTAAVVAGGIDHFYPPENEALQKQIAKDQVLISEMPMGTIPKAEHFPRRNRIISGISRAVIVVEAALRSGSLITARMAAEQGRDVFAVPGSPLDPRCEGANRLIRDGASLLMSVDDVLEALREQGRTHRMILREPEQNHPSTDELSDSERDHLLNLLSHAPIHMDDLAREARLSPDVLAACLLELEVAGRINRSAGGGVQLAPA